MPKTLELALRFDTQCERVQKAVNGVLNMARQFGTPGHQIIENLKHPKQLLEQCEGTLNDIKKHLRSKEKIWIKTPKVKKKIESLQRVINMSETNIENLQNLITEVKEAAEELG